MTARSVERHALAFVTNRRSPPVFFAQATIVLEADVVAKAMEPMAAATTLNPPRRSRRFVRERISFRPLPLGKMSCGLNVDASEPNC